VVFFCIYLFTCFLKPEWWSGWIVTVLLCPPVLVVIAKYLWTKHRVAVDLAHKVWERSRYAPPAPTPVLPSTFTPASTFATNEKGLSHKEACLAIVRHLSGICQVHPHIEERIYKDLNRRPDVWAHERTKWYLCEVKRAGWPDLANASMELDTMRTEIRKRETSATFSCYIAVTKELYDSLSVDKQTQLHDSARNLRIGIMTVDSDGSCRDVEKPY